MGTGFSGGGPDSIGSTVPISEESIVTDALPRGQTTRSSVDDVCVMLGVPVEDRKSFAQWAADLRDLPHRTVHDVVVHPSLDAVHAYVDVMIAERCTHPTDDLLSKLIDAKADAFAFTTDELRLSVTALLAMAAANESPSPRG
jgi:cytochrome P450